MGWGSLQVWNERDRTVRGLSAHLQANMERRNGVRVPKIEFAPANSGKIGTVINLASGTVFGDFFEAGARITKADDTQVERARELHAARRSVKELRAERALELGRPARTARRRRSRLSHS
jgi:hypothetical protein